MVPLNTPKFFSAYSSLLYQFVDSKRITGYKYNGEVKELQRLDKFFSGFVTEHISESEDEFYDWLRKRHYESDKTFSNRNSVYRQLYAFATSVGITNLPKPLNAREKIKASGFVPYIFNHDEINRMFKAIDLCKSNSSFVRCAPLLFRLLYATGLRINEALSLCFDDVYLEQKLIVIRDGKNDNSRLIPLSETLYQYMYEYVKEYDNSKTKALFLNMHNTPLKQNTAYDWYRQILWKAGIPHYGRGKGPRLHDLRHTFAVHSLQNAIDKGMDVNAFLPLLCTYLGHKRLASTERYLRLTAEAYPSVMKDINLIMNPLIPEVHDYE